MVDSLYNPEMGDQLVTASPSLTYQNKEEHIYYN
jgi:hypothetical protein